MNQQYPTISDLCLAVDHGLLTKDEARLIVLDWFPSAKRLEEAKRIVESVNTQTGS